MLSVFWCTFFGALDIWSVTTLERCYCYFKLVPQHLLEKQSVARNAETETLLKNGGFQRFALVSLFERAATWQGHAEADPLLAADAVIGHCAP